MVKLFEKQTWKGIGNYLAYYIDYFISAFWNLLKVWCILTICLILLPIPPVLWKVHAFMWEMVSGGSIPNAMAKMKYASPPMDKDD